MTHKDCICLVLREIEDKFDGCLPPNVSYAKRSSSRYERQLCQKYLNMRHGILLLGTGLIAALYAHHFKDGVDSSILWDAGVAQMFEEWAKKRLEDPNYPPPNTEDLFRKLEKYMRAQ